jgi:hypothetical protein
MKRTIHCVCVKIYRIIKSLALYGINDIQMPLIFNITLIKINLTFYF